MQIRNNLKEIFDVQIGNIFKMSLEDKTGPEEINQAYTHRLLTKDGDFLRSDIGVPIAYARLNFIQQGANYIFRDSIGNLYTNFPFTREELQELLPKDPKKAVIEGYIFPLEQIYRECNIKNHTPNFEIIKNNLQELKGFLERKV